LQKLFKEGTGHSVMDYFKEMKMQEIKHLIREENHNFTEIAEILGYSSIHYLSRTFKANTGMTLSEYASSVKALLDN
jgi:AraC-like DNA-binding protein